MADLLYLQAAGRFIGTLLLFIASFLPGRTEPLTWDETLSNVEQAANAGNKDAILMIVMQEFYDVPQQAINVINCENRNWNPRAVSATGDTGIFQINWVHQRRGALAEGLDLTDVRTNVRVARQLYEGRGWVPWACRWAAWMAW